MLAQRGNIFHVEFVQRHDAVDGLRPGDVADGINQALQRKLFRHGKDSVQAVARPVGVFEFFYGEQQDAATQGFARADKFLPLFVGAYAQDGYRFIVGHKIPSNSTA